MTLSAINTATDEIGKVVPLTGLPVTGQFAVAITSNGAYIYVLGQGSGKTASTVVAVAAATDVARKPIQVGIDDAGLAVTPNSKLVYVLSPGRGYEGPPISPQPKNAPGTVIPIHTATNKVGNPKRSAFLQARSPSRHRRDGDSNRGPRL